VKNNAVITGRYLVQNLFLPMVYLKLVGLVLSTAGSLISEVLPLDVPLGFFGDAIKSWIALFLFTIGMMFSNEFSCSS